MMRRNRGDYARALVFIAHEAADACAHPAFRAPSFEGKECEGFRRARALKNRAVGACLFLRERGRPRARRLK
jgi:hypothetical protein